MSFQETQIYVRNRTKVVNTKTKRLFFHTCFCIILEFDNLKIINLCFYLAET